METNRISPYRISAERRDTKEQDEFETVVECLAGLKHPPNEILSDLYLVMEKRIDAFKKSTFGYSQKDSDRIDEMKADKASILKTIQKLWEIKRYDNEEFSNDNIPF